MPCKVRDTDKKQKTDRDNRDEESSKDKLEFLSAPGVRTWCFRWMLQDWGRAGTLLITKTKLELYYKIKNKKAKWSAALGEAEELWNYNGREIASTTTKLGWIAKLLHSIPYQYKAPATTTSVYWAQWARWVRWSITWVAIGVIKMRGEDVNLAHADEWLKDPSLAEEKLAYCSNPRIMSSFFLSLFFPGHLFKVFLRNCSHLPSCPDRISL